MSDDLPLLLRIKHPRQSRQEPLDRVRHAQLDSEVAVKRGIHEFRLAPPHEPVVDEDAHQAIADGAVYERRHHAAVHAAGKAADDPIGRSNLLANGRDGRLDNVVNSPIAPASADVIEEIADDLRALRRMRDLRVELDAEDRPRPVPNGSNGAVGRLRQALKAIGHTRHHVAVAHPDGDIGGQMGQHTFSTLHV